MSSSVKQVKSWLSFILDPDTPFKQILSILTSTSDLQIQALTEIFHNLRNNPDIQLDNSLIRKLQRKKWNTLAKDKISARRKRTFIKENKREIVHILLAMRETLQQVIDHE